jgi:hypothetical protein
MPVNLATWEGRRERERRWRKQGGGVGEGEEEEEEGEEEGEEKEKVERRKKTKERRKKKKSTPRLPLTLDCSFPFHRAHPILFSKLTQSSFQYIVSAPARIINKPWQPTVIAPFQDCILHHITFLVYTCVNF